METERTSRTGTWAYIVLLLGLIVLSGAVPAALPGSAQALPQQGLRTIVIDPGHGGSEIGATGPNGLTEKEITLDIARRLRDLIRERLGLQVHLTRESDYDVALENRTEKANNLKADVFISIHANSYRGRGVRGSETYFLSDKATDDDARRVAALENDALGLESTAPGDTGLQLLLWDMAQTMHLRESSVLAETIQGELNRLAGTGNRGIKQAPFRVLRGADMPAVLVEVGFLSNPDEASSLADPRYRQRLATALFNSLDQYRRRQDRLVGGGPRQ
jgi:N-acetylmuramoyl-L-alanine amidase